MSEKDITIKDLVTIFQKYIEEPDQFGKWQYISYNNIKHGSDEDGFYFILRNKKYRCFNEEIKYSVELPSLGTKFDPRADILICQNTFSASNNDPMEKHVLIRITDTDTPISYMSTSIIRGYISGKNDNEAYVNALQISCPRKINAFISDMNYIIKFLNEPISLEYKDKDKANSRDVIREYFRLNIESEGILTKPINSGFGFTLGDKEYTCTVEEEYFKINDRSFNTKTDFLISPENFVPNDKERSDRYAIITVLNEYQDPHNGRLMECKSSSILDNNKKDEGMLIIIKLFQKNNRFGEDHFRDIVGSILRFLMEKDSFSENDVHVSVPG